MSIKAFLLQCSTLDGLQCFEWFLVLLLPLLSHKLELVWLPVQVPVGVAVEQPGGDYAYGAPASPQRGRAYVPPSHPAAAAGHSPMAQRHDSAAQV